MEPVQHVGDHGDGSRYIEGCPGCAAESRERAEAQARAGREQRRGPEAVGEIVQRVFAGDRFVESVCSRCKGPMLVDTKGDGAREECSDCLRETETRARLEREAERLEANINRWLPSWLKRQGMSPRELRAELEEIPPPLRGALFDRSHGVEELVSEGRLVDPERGFGISAGAGAGKTFALAAIFKAAVRARWQAGVSTEGLAVMKRAFLSWVSWPEAVGSLRTASLREGGHEEAAKFIEELARVELLVVDDLGAERLRGTYDTDWTASLLDDLIDTRYNELMPTWYTTNLSRAELLERYGSRLFSRLTSQNPLVAPPALPDLRLR